MVMYAKIRRMFFREHLSISEIARRTTLTRNTIKKWLKAADGSEPKYRRIPKLTKLTPFEPNQQTSTGLFLYSFHLKSSGNCGAIPVPPKMP